MGVHLRHQLLHALAAGHGVGDLLDQVGRVQAVDVGAQHLAAVIEGEAVFVGVPEVIEPEDLVLAARFPRRAFVQILDEFIEQHPSQQAEFSLLQKTKLEADQSILFANKELLFRYETKLIRFAWQRIAIAAAILLFVSLTILFQLRSNKEQPAYVKQTITPANNKGVANENSSLKNETSHQPAQVDKTLASGDNTVNNKPQQNNPAYSHENNIIPVAAKNNIPVVKNSLAKQDNRQNNKPVTPLTRGNIQAPVQQLVTNNNPLNTVESPVQSIGSSIKDIIKKTPWYTDAYDLVRIYIRFNEGKIKIVEISEE